MARTIREEQHAEKRNEILDAAAGLVYTRGYEQVSIQGIIDALQISKGAFYHYFSSKQDLLEALIERTLDQSMHIILPIVEDPGLDALEKLNRFFSTVGQWKAAQKSYMLALLNVYYADDNAVLRQKLLAKSIQRVAPLLNHIVRQGLAEGVFHTPFPDQAGEVLLSLLVGSGENIAARMIALGMGEVPPARLDAKARQDGLLAVQSAAGAYVDAMERILGAPAGSIALFTPGVLEDWFDEPPPAPPPVPATPGAAGGNL